VTRKRSSAKPKGEDLDGAQYFSRDHRPFQFMSGTDGLRPNETREPHGTMYVDLSKGTSGRVIPPRFIWKEGHFRGNSDRDFRIWVTSGEATPGNYEERHYELPTSIAAQSEPDHPEDWPKSLKDGASSSSSSSWGWGGGSKRDSLPWGLRIRCPGCGHFFKENDLKDHVNSACPAKQGDMVMWIIECECHPGDLLAAIGRRHLAQRFCQ